MASRLKIVLVGGGSVAWTPRILKDMLLKESLNAAEFVLLDIDKKAADHAKTFAQKLARRIGAKASFVSTNSRARAMKGADYVLITISTGGLDAMAYDLSIPEQYGIYHTVGDTCGPGGWARFIRNFNVFVSLARDINRYAPRAIVLNYTNPMTTLTDVLSRICKGPVIGLCHGIFGSLDFFRKVYGLKSVHEAAADYAGLNHFFWIREVRAGKRDLLADLKRKVRTKSLTSLLKTTHDDPMGWASGHDIATELLRLTGFMPYIADRHTCEFYPYYITSKKNIKKYGIKRTSIAQRRKVFAFRKRNFMRMVTGTFDEEFLQPSRETAADIIEAHCTNKTFIDVGNVPNIGQISSLPHGAIVETAVRVDRNGFSPIAFGAFPDTVQCMVEPIVRVYTMSVDACFAKDKTLALQALRADPVCSHLNTEQVNEMGERLLKAHRKYITVF